MKILVLNYEYPPLGGGGGVATKQIVEGLVDMGHKIDIVTSHHKDLPKYESASGVNIYRVYVGRQSISTASLASMLSYPISGFTTTVTLCRKSSYDCIHSHFAVPSGVLGVLISRLFDIPHVLSVHGGDIYDPTKSMSPHKKPLLRRMVTAVLHRADQVVAQSSDIRLRATEHYGIESNAIDVIPLPYEPFEYDPVSTVELGLDPNKTYLISIGRLVDRKGYNYLLRALPELDDSVELLLAGDGPKKDSLVALAEELGISDRVTFLGYVSEVEKFLYLDVSSVYVLSSLHEGFGIVLQEAMQTGLPIVATNDGGQTDLVEDGTNGILVPPRDPQALADGIKEVLAEDLHRYAERNTNRIKRYALDRVCNSYLNCFEHVSNH